MAPFPNPGLEPALKCRPRSSWHKWQPLGVGLANEAWPGNPGGAVVWCGCVCVCAVIFRTASCRPPSVPGCQGDEQLCAATGTGVMGSIRASQAKCQPASRDSEGWGGGAEGWRRTALQRVKLSCAPRALSPLVHMAGNADLCPWLQILGLGVFSPARPFLSSPEQGHLSSWPGTDPLTGRSPRPCLASGSTSWDSA